MVLSYSHYKDPFITYNSGIKEYAARAPFRGDWQDAIKSIGGKWDGTNKTWWIPNSNDDKLKYFMLKYWGKVPDGAGLDMVKIRIQPEKYFGMYVHHWNPAGSMTVMIDDIWLTEFADRSNRKLVASDIVTTESNSRVWADPRQLEEKRETFVLQLPLEYVQNSPDLKEKGYEIIHQGTSLRAETESEFDIADKVATNADKRIKELEEQIADLRISLGKATKKREKARAKLEAIDSGAIVDMTPKYFVKLRRTYDDDEPSLYGETGDYRYVIDLHSEYPDGGGKNSTGEFFKDMKNQVWRNEEKEALMLQEIEHHIELLSTQPVAKAQLLDTGFPIYFLNLTAKDLERRLPHQFHILNQDYYIHAGIDKDIVIDTSKQTIKINGADQDNFGGVDLSDIGDPSKWLEIRFSIDGLTVEEIDDLLENMPEGKIYQTKSGQIVDLEEFYRESEAFRRIRGLSKVKNGKVQIPKGKIGAIQALLGDKDVELSDYVEQLTTDLTHPEEFDCEVPNSIHATLRPYQVTGFQWFKSRSKHGFGGILADEMGLGKTLQTITYFAHEKEQRDKLNEDFLGLVVAPASLIYNWQAEFEKFAPSLNVLVMHGGVKDKRQEEVLAIKDNLVDVDIVITTYNTYRIDQEAYRQVPFTHLVMDEAQQIKNSTNKITKAILKGTYEHAFALTGTPIENSLEELRSIMQAVNPGLFPNKQEFKKLSTEIVRDTSLPFILRRTKADVLQDLPERTDIFFESEMERDQKEAYLSILEAAQEGVAKEKVARAQLKAQGKSDKDINKIIKASGNSGSMMMLAAITRLKQVIDYPRLIDDSYPRHSGKFEQFLELVKMGRENGRRILVFSQFKSMIDVMKQTFEKQGLDAFVIDGSVPSEERQDQVNRFNDGEGDIFLISTKAGNTGLNLTGADTVILYDLWWNPAVDEQAIGRAHRIGQKRNVEVWHMITKDTIDEQILEIQETKKDLYDKVLDSGEVASSLSKEDMLKILGAR
jgi:SNF2 family DNA or RNA helicase